MILYFSSTGNCKFVAEKLAEEFNDTSVSITDKYCINLSAGEKLGFVFPTYFWRLPSFVDEFMERVVITSEDKEPYIFFVATYGTTCGQSGTFMKNYLKMKGFNLSASYSIKMADDWTVWFDLSDEVKVQSILEAEKPQVEYVINSVKNEEKGNKMKNTLPMIAAMWTKPFYKIARNTKHLHVGESCVGCGLCERECPVLAIEIQRGKPVWVKGHCTMCLHCLHSCPKFAIQYDNSTKNHGQYKHP